MLRSMSVSLVVGVLLVAATSRGDIGAPDARPEATPFEEPVIGGVPTPSGVVGGMAVSKAAFAPYESGAANIGTWAYRDLNESERAVADRGRNSDGWTDINEAFSSASGEQAKSTAAAAAESQLGVSRVSEIGVVP
jgi:hypothetical protein